MTLYYYLQSSLKNPGFIQGNTLYEVAVSHYRKFKIFMQNIGAYNPNMDILKKEGQSAPNDHL